MEILSEQEVIEVGTKVQYVPSLAHALDKDANGDYAWVIGRKIQRNGEETIEELSGKKLTDTLDAANRAPNPTEARKALVFIRPKRTWSAVVRAVHEDGTCDLDIQGLNAGVTLHYDHVRPGWKQVGTSRQWDEPLIPDTFVF